jgi:6-phosphogluconolactonase
MAEFVCKIWSRSEQEAIKRRGSFFVALSGGKTPVDIYRELAKFSQNCSWHKTHLFVTDERFVPWTHKESNYRLIKKTLLTHIAIPEMNVHPVRIRRSAVISAQEYENDLIKTFHLKRRQWPRFDLILLGIGKDGHIASLFPNSLTLAEKRLLAAPVCHGKRQRDRVTITMPVICHARQIIFLVTGKQKAKIIKEILLDQGRSPALLVLRKNKEVLFVLDEKSASLLGTSFGKTAQRSSGCFRSAR